MIRFLNNEKMVKRIWVVLGMLILPAFLFWGFGSVSRSRKTSSYAGKVFGRKVTSQEFGDALNAVKDLAIMQYGESLSEVKDYLNLESQAWERLILLFEARKYKIRVSDQEVIESIKNNPYFQRNGKFDDKIYLDMLKYVFRTKARIFEEETRQNIILTKLYGEITSKVNIDESELLVEYRKTNEEIRIYYIASLIEDFKKAINPSEEDMQAYFLKNSVEFKKPLSFNIGYVICEEEEKLRNLVKNIGNKKDLKELAKDSGIEFKETGFFTQTDPVPGIGWVPEITKMVSKLKTGEHTPILKIDNSYYIIKVNEKKEPYIPEFKEVKESVKERFKEHESEKLAEIKIKECLTALNKLKAREIRGSDFEKTAKEFFLKSGSTEFFKYGSYIEGLGASDIFWDTASDLKNGKFSNIIRNDSGFYIIGLKDRKPIDEKKFAAEREAFKKRLLLRKKQEFFLAFLEDLKRRNAGF